MGFVVSAFMLLAVLLLTPWPAWIGTRRRSRPAGSRALASGVLVAGLWNSLWHGLRHLGDFWGIAALVSGLLMVAAAVLILRNPTDSNAPSGPSVSGAPQTVKPLTALLIASLLAFFMLYAVTLARLNLGLPIIGA